ncbi:MAG: dethiobiotin synthase [Puniceicoccales bacterium]|jgi:dethiobiotin synthase|nr:dethiobiotin synthase [Puniceicoccales bacterium]
MNIFVTGADTNVGKTVVSAWLCLHTNANYWKPIQTGNDSDKNVVAKLSPYTKIIPEIYKLKAPLSPYDASKLEGIEIDRNLFGIDVHNTVIEGAGGILVPIAKNFLMVDLIKTCEAKVLIVAKSKLGMINHLLMTSEVLRSRAIDILGIAINGKIENNLKNTIEEFSRLKILSVIPQSEDLVGTLQSKTLPPEFLEVLK